MLVIRFRHCGWSVRLDSTRAYKLCQRRLNGKPHFSYYQARMAMMLLTQDESDLLTPEGYTNINAFSTSDDFESYSPTDDPILKYTEDPPALIAYVAHFSYIVAL